MTCSDEELEARVVQAKARGLVRVLWTNLFRLPGSVCGLVWLDNLSIHVDGVAHGPFATVDEAVNMIILLGGGPK